MQCLQVAEMAIFIPSVCWFVATYYGNRPKPEQVIAGYFKS